MMTSKLQRFLWTAAVALPLSVLLVGCGQKSSSSNKQDLNLVEAGDPTTLDVNDIRNSNEDEILSNAEEGLFRTIHKDGKDKLQLAGAKSYTLSKDKLIYTFKRRSSKWSDGKPVVAQQYVDSVIRELNPKNGFANAMSAFDIKNAKQYNSKQVPASSVGVKAPNKSTFVITLGHPTPNFVQSFSDAVFYPVRLDLIKKHGNKEWKTDWKDQVTNGPFKITQWKTNDKLVLTKNPKYWNAKNVKLKKVTYISTSKDSTISSLLQSGQLDADVASGTQALDFKKVAKSGKLNINKMPGTAANLIVFNQKTGGPQGLLKNAKIRKALSLAIDRKAYNKIVASGQEKPAQGFVPASANFGSVNYRKYAGNILAGPEKEYKSSAKLKRLFQAGLKEEGKSTDLSKVKLIYLTETNDSSDSDIISFIKQQYKDKLGITVNASAQPDDASFIAQRNKGKYDFLTNGWIGANDPQAYLELWYSKGGFQQFFGGYHDTKYDKLYDSLSGVSSVKQRLKIYKELETLLVTKDYGVAPTTVPVTTIFTSKSLHNFQTPLFGAGVNYVYAYKK